MNCCCSAAKNPAADSVRTLVPVSVRATGTESTVDNEVSLLLPLLPVDVADPVQRLIRVHQRLGSLKAAKEADAGALLTASAGHEPFAPIAWAIRAAAHLPQRNIVTVTTNIPGPRKPLSVLGREIVAMYPYVPIALRVRTGVAMLSYAGRSSSGSPPTPTPSRTRRCWPRRSSGKSSRCAARPADHRRAASNSAASAATSASGSGMSLRSVPNPNRTCPA